MQRRGATADGTVVGGGKLVGVDEENDAVLVEMHHRPPASLQAILRRVGCFCNSSGKVYEYSSP